MIYNNLKELGNNTLRMGDIVYFYTDGKQLKYSVQSTHLSNMLICNNAEIFSILNIVNRNDFCNYNYGYPSHGGDWPTCRIGDCAALTRVVRALYLEIERKKTQENVTHSYSSYFTEKLKTTLSDTLPMSLFTTSSVVEKEENTSSNILVKRKSKIKRIIGEESIKLNNY